VPEVTGGEAVVRTLKALGVDTVFGLIGVHALPIYDALYQHPEVRHIGVRHEQTAAFMADGYARVTGRPGVCITTTGPGAANTAAAMGTSWWDSVPVLNLMSQVPSDMVDRNKGVLHEPKDQLGMFRALTKWNARVTRVEDIPGTLQQAFRTMVAERPRPTQVEVCTDVLNARGDAESVPWLAEGTAFERPRAEPNLVDEAAVVLARAERPVVWAGGGVSRSGAWQELVRLSERLQAPVLTTVQGAGTIPYDHPLALGFRPGDRRITELLEGADALLAVGTKFVARATGDWTHRLPRQLIHVDIDPEEIGKNYPASHGLVGDAREVLRQLLGALAVPGNRTCWAGDVSAVRGEIEGRVRERGALEMSLLYELRDTVERDAILVWDQTKPAYWAARSFPVLEPRTFLYPGYGTLGFAFPTALGAKVGQPERQVVCVCGDGGFQLALPDLATAAQFGINVAVLLFNDNAFGILKDLQDLSWQGHHYAVDLVNPDFARLAELYGLRGVVLEGPEGLGRALREALQADCTTVIEVRMEFRRPGA